MAPSTTLKPSSSSLVGSIFGNSGAKNDRKKDAAKEKKNTLSNLFSSSSKLPQKPNIVSADAFPKPVHSAKRKQSQKEDDLIEEKEGQTNKKIVKGGKKRMRNKEKTVDEKPISEKEQKNEGGTEDDVEDSSNNEEENVQNDVLSKDEEDRTVFVGNLPLSTTRKKLFNLFKHCGAIKSTRLRSIAATGAKVTEKGNQNLVKKVCLNKTLIDSSYKKTMQGYVVFEDKESVPKALALNNSLLSASTDSGSDTPRTKSETEKTLRIRVDTAKPTIDTARSVFVGNLRYGVEENDLMEHFERGINDDKEYDDEDDNTDETKMAVEAVRIIRDPDTMKCKGFGYVLMKNKELVADALRLDQSLFQKKNIRVNVCGKRFKGRRGDSPSSEGTKYDSKYNHNNNKMKINFEGARSTHAAAKRIMAKLNQHHNSSTSQENNKSNKKKTNKDKQKKEKLTSKKRRTYSEKNSAKVAKTSGISKRAAKESKINKRVKKLNKRVKKGMGKMKH